MSITQGGNGLPFLAESVYEYISTGVMPREIEMDVDAIPDRNIKFCVNKVHILSLLLLWPLFVCIVDLFIIR